MFMDLNINVKDNTKSFEITNTNIKIHWTYDRIKLNTNWNDKIIINWNRLNKLFVSWFYCLNLFHSFCQSIIYKLFISSDYQKQLFLTCVQMYDFELKWRTYMLLKFKVVSLQPCDFAENEKFKLNLWVYNKVEFYIVLFLMFT